MTAFNNFIEKEGVIVDSSWVEWEHISVPNKPEWLREIIRNLLAILGHCLICTSLDGCYFVNYNKPKYPQHERCDCKINKISNLQVSANSRAECDIRKFTEYIFTNEQDSKGKNKIFEDLGYNKNDSKELQYEFCKQANKEYLKGNYKLKTLDSNGQRVAIAITLKDKSFYSGWILRPDGMIKNTTPFGGWIK